MYSPQRCSVSIHPLLLHAAPLATQVTRHLGSLIISWCAWNTLDKSDVDILARFVWGSAAQSSAAVARHFWHHDCVTRFQFLP